MAAFARMNPPHPKVKVTGPQIPPAMAIVMTIVMSMPIPMTMQTAVRILQLQCIYKNEYLTKLKTQKMI